MGSQNQHSAPANLEKLRSMKMLLAIHSFAALLIFHFTFLLPIQTISFLHFHSANKSQFCSKGCSIDENCATNQGCFRIRIGSSLKSCCLGVLRPNDEGCLLDEQCERSCIGSKCNLKTKPPRCSCPEGKHVLFHACWFKCPSGFLPFLDTELQMSRCALPEKVKEEREAQDENEEIPLPSLLQINRERPEKGTPKGLYC